jgi:hypothetical protein
VTIPSRATTLLIRTTSRLSIAARTLALFHHRRAVSVSGNSSRIIQRQGLGIQLQRSVLRAASRLMCQEYRFVTLCAHHILCEKQRIQELVPGIRVE